MVTPPPIELSNLGMWDSMILMILALVVFGPRRLPQIGRQVGKLMYEFRKASNDFKFQMEEELRLAEDADRRKKEEEERVRNLALSPPAETQSVEAHADIGAAEQASVSAPPPVSAPGEIYPGVDAAAAPAVETEEHAHYPRINPPSTGDPVAASRPNGASAITADVPADSSVAAEANIGAEPAAPVAGPAVPGEPTHTETVTQHG